MPVIYGFLERITYYNEENDCVVAKQPIEVRNSFYLNIGL